MKKIIAIILVFSMFLGTITANADTFDRKKQEYLKVGNYQFIRWSIKSGERFLAIDRDGKLHYTEDDVFNYKVVTIAGIPTIIHSKYSGINLKAILNSMDSDGEITVLAGNQGKLFLTRNGKDFTELVTGLKEDLYHVFYNPMIKDECPDKVWQATGTNGVYLTSPDGIHWKNETNDSDNMIFLWNEERLDKLNNAFPVYHFYSVNRVNGQLVSIADKSKTKDAKLYVVYLNKDLKITEEAEIGNLKSIENVDFNDVETQAFTYRLKSTNKAVTVTANFKILYLN